MKKKFNPLYTLFVLITGFASAQLPSQPVPPGTGQGTTGTGSQSIPVDMYVYVLAVAAIMLIAFFARKYKTQKI